MEDVMATVKPFLCVRPEATLAHRVAALPYDVYSRAEAKAKVAEDELTFLRIDRAETQFDDDVDTYDDRVYEKARELLEAMVADGTFVTEECPCYYVYELTMDGRTQTGIVACASIDDYQNNIIKKHENTRAEKEQDRIRHVDRCSAQTGPIFLAYRSNEIIASIIKDTKQKPPLYDFVADDEVTHRIWCISEENKVESMRKAFDKIEQIYIADGHHRAASAVKVGMKRREEKVDYDANDEFNYFLSVLFPEDQLMIMAYNRVIKDLNGIDKVKFLEFVAKNFNVRNVGKDAYKPTAKGAFGMYLDGEWYELLLSEALQSISDPVAALDVSILQDYLLSPILGIGDPRVDKRIDFVGGIRGLIELERRVNEGMAVAFSMYPTSIQELFAVSDVDKLMPPKSTWFEPKLRSGLFIHRI